MVNPMNRFSFGFDENFLRSIRASNFETDTNANRDLNTLRLTFLYHPQQRSLSGYLYLQNIIDVFEQANDFYPNRMDTRAGFHLTWQWLPKTQFFGDVSEGMVGGLGSSAAAEAKSDSFPLIARVGIASLLSLKTSVNLSAGYTNGFYSTGPSFSAPYVDAAVTYKYSPFGQLGVGYSWLHVDSVNANYYRDHVARAFVQQLFAPFAVMIQPEVHFREYVGTTIPDLNGGTTRDDLIFQVISGVHYNFRNWIAATIDYKFTTVQTDFSYMEQTGQTVDLNYVRHELLLGMRFAM
jgi:predicted porin